MENQELIMHYVDEEDFNGEVTLKGEENPSIIEAFKERVAAVTLWFEENGQQVNSENLERFRDRIKAFTDKIINGEDTSSEKDSPKYDTMTNTELTDEIRSMKQMGFWILVALVVLIILK